MSRKSKRLWQSAARVVAPTQAEAVFDEWADSFEIESGWSYPGSKFNSRRRARVRFSRGGGAYVYFAVAPAGPIKIGLSEQPLIRVRSFPGYEIVAAVSEQDTRGEISIHEELIDFKRKRNEPGFIHGVKHEWFQRNSPVLSLVYRLANAATSQLTLAEVGAA